MGSKRNRGRAHARRPAGGSAYPGADPLAERLRLSIAASARNLAARHAAGTWRPGAGDAPKHTYFASCTRAQANQYGCIEYGMKMGLLARHVYPMAAHAPRGGGAYFLLVMSNEGDAFRAELPLLFPGVDAWYDLDEERDARGLRDDDEPGPDLGPLHISI